MHNLDNTIREILEDLEHYHYYEGNSRRDKVKPDTLDKIKAAYKEAGYVQTLKLNNRTIVANGKDNLGYIVYYPDEVMTGQEWLARFMAELKKEASLTHHTPNPRKSGFTLEDFNIELAAKRASGDTDA